MRDGNGHRTQGAGIGAGMAFLGGGLIALLGARLLPPILGQLVGSQRDPFELLAADHRRVLALLDRLAGTDTGQRGQRTMLLLTIKRALTAHALAEEDVVYPALKMQAEEEDDAKQLYAEHAEIKMYLHKLEMMPKDEPAFVDTVRELRDLIARHAHQEETVDFPKLRQRLDAAATATLAGAVVREKAMVL